MLVWWGEGKDARAINAAMCKLTDYLAGCGYYR